MFKFDVLFLTYYDWSNYTYKTSESLRKLGLSVLGFKGSPHQFNYPFQLPIYYGLVNAPPYCMFPIITTCHSLKKYIDRAKVIWFSAETFINTGANLHGHGVVVDYGACTYRMEPERCNAIFNPIVDDTVILFPALLGHGGKNEHLIYYPVDTGMFIPRYKLKGDRPLRIGHFPSTTENKGSDVIQQAINNVNNDYSGKFEYFGPKHPDIKVVSEVDWMFNLERMASCDIIIETVKPVLKERPFGEWGNQALEAASLGKIVITNSIHNDIYMKEYGDHELILANNQEQLENQLVNIFQMTDTDILNKQHAVREWVVKKHGMIPTAQRIYDEVLKKHLT